MYRKTEKLYNSKGKLIPRKLFLSYMKAIIFVPGEAAPRKFVAGAAAEGFEEVKEIKTPFSDVIVVQDKMGVTTEYKQMPYMAIMG